MTKNQIVIVLNRWVETSIFHPQDYDMTAEWAAGKLAREDIRDELITLVTQFEDELMKGGNDELRNKKGSAD